MSFENTDQKLLHVSADHLCLSHCFLIEGTMHSMTTIFEAATQLSIAEMHAMKTNFVEELVNTGSIFKTVTHSTNQIYWNPM